VTSKRRVRGIARSVELRADQNGVTTLLLRVDRYDGAGNRLGPVAVEMQARRAGRVTDGDEIEASGRWSRGTLQATKIKNLTTASEVIGYPRWLKWAVLGVFLLVVAGGAYAVVGGALPSLLAGRVAVPNVVGMDEMAAFSRMGQAGLVPDSTTESSASVAQGRVIRTDPMSSVEVDRGSAVNLVVSSGASGIGEATFPAGLPQASDPPAAERVPVPALGGLDEASAIASLTDVGLASDTRRETNDSVPEGAVIRSDPGAGSLLGIGAQVTLVISAGPAAGIVTDPPVADIPVPSVTGMAQADAEAALADAGLLVAVTTEGFCVGDPPVVVQADPAPGTLVPAGSTVTLVATC